MVGVLSAIRPSSPVLRGLGASNGAWPLDNYPETEFEKIGERAAPTSTCVSPNRTCGPERFQDAQAFS
jgi:hypothetical protein